MKRMAVAAALASCMAMTAPAQNCQVLGIGIPPGSDASEPRAINNAGRVVGYSHDGFQNGRRAFLFNRNSCTRTDLGALIPGSIESEANAINDNGTIVGSFTAGRTKRRAFRSLNGVFQELPGSTLTDHLPLGANRLPGRRGSLIHERWRKIRRLKVRGGRRPVAPALRVRDRAEILPELEPLVPDPPRGAERAAPGL